MFSVLVVPLWSIVGLSFVFRLRCLVLQEQVKTEVKLRAPPPIKCKRNSWCSLLHNYLPNVLGRLECIYLHPLFWAESHLFMRMVMVWYFVTVCQWQCLILVVLVLILLELTLWFIFKVSSWSFVCNRIEMFVGVSVAINCVWTGKIEALLCFSISQNG